MEFESVIIVSQWRWQGGQLLPQYSSTGGLDPPPNKIGAMTVLLLLDAFGSALLLRARADNIIVAPPPHCMPVQRSLVLNT